MNAETTKKTPAAKPARAVKPVAAKAADKAVKTPASKEAAKKTPEVKKSKKESRIKVVRDSFTMPRSEYQQIATIKEACLKAGTPVKKSEVLRAGLQTLLAMSAPQLKAAMGKLEKIATGRPKKSH